VEYCSDEYICTSDADAVVIMTEMTAEEQERVIECVGKVFLEVALGNPN